MAIGWLISIASANQYFVYERLRRNWWDALEESGDAKKTAALTQAFNRLYYGNEFVLPTYADASVDQLIVLRKVNCEMAYYLAQHLKDEDRRKNIQAQVSAFPVLSKRLMPKTCSRTLQFRRSFVTC